MLLVLKTTSNALICECLLGGCVFTHTVVCEPKCAPSRVWVLRHTVVREQVRVLALPQTLLSPPPSLHRNTGITDLCDSVCLHVGSEDLNSGLHGYQVLYSLSHLSS